MLVRIRLCEAIAIFVMVVHAACNGSAASEHFDVGVAAVDITPPVGFRKGGGYGEVISTGVHDPLFAKAMVIRHGDDVAVIVICDLLSVAEPISSAARKAASKKTGIPVANIVIAATHNHGSPEYWGSLRDIFHETAIENHGRDPHESIDYQKQLVAACVRAISEADGSRQSVTCNIVVAQQRGLAFNRRFHMRDGTVRFNPGRGNRNIVRPAGPVDTELPFLLFRSTEQERKPLASLAVFAMHTAVFGGREFGADFPGHLQTRLRERFGESFVSLFAEGAAGDINHIDVSQRNAPATDLPRKIGVTLADSITDHLPLARSVAAPSLAVRSRTIHAPFEPITEERYKQARSLLANQRTARAPFLTLVAAWRDCHRYNYTKQYGDKKPLEVQAIRLNRDTAIVSLPHEIFVEIGMAIKAASPFRNTIVISLANDVDFYIPTRRAFEEGSYEVTTCPFNPGCGELLIRTASELLQELKEQ